MPWAAMRPRWEECLTELPGFIEVGEQSVVDLAWVGWIVVHLVAGVPLGEVVDWIHAEVHRVTSAGA